MLRTEAAPAEKTEEAHMRLGIFSDHLREYARAENLSCREAAELFGQYGVCETEIGYGEWGEHSPGAYADSFGLRVR